MVILLYESKEMWYMNILFLDWPCFCKVDTILTFRELGHKVDTFFHKDYLEYESESYDESFASAIKDKHYDILFSYNFYPHTATLCHQWNITYVSFIYDSPFVGVYSKESFLPTNRIFHFDSFEVDKLTSLGHKNIYYMPLPVNGKVIHTLLTKPYDKKRVTSDISLVGALYTESNNFYDQMKSLSDYTKGYLASLMSVQSTLYGVDIIERSLTSDIIEDMERSFKCSGNATGVETPAYIYGNYVVARKLTAIERSGYLHSIGKHFNDRSVKLFTLDDTTNIPNVSNMGIADYYSEMPYVFHHSKINLNISLRSIHSGIPLRAMDILGNGGFLLTNYQADFLRHFEPEVDFVYYDSKEDLLDKIDYYLNHEDIRKSIAISGHKKVIANHNFNTILSQILNIISLD